MAAAEHRRADGLGSPVPDQYRCRIAEPFLVEVRGHERLAVERNLQSPNRERLLGKRANHLPTEHVDNGDCLIRPSRIHVLAIGGKCDGKGLQRKIVVRTSQFTGVGVVDAYYGVLVSRGQP